MRPGNVKWPSSLVPWGSCDTMGEAVGACAATFLMVFRFLFSPEWYRLGQGYDSIAQKM